MVSLTERERQKTTIEERIAQVEAQIERDSRSSGEPKRSKDMSAMLSRLRTDFGAIGTEMEVRCVTCKRLHQLCLLSVYQG